MHISCILLFLLGGYGLVNALAELESKPLDAAQRRAPFSPPGLPAARAICPLSWTTIGLELKLAFVGLGGCNNLAREAIRAAFHDCFVNGCNGSLMLSDECSRKENNGLEDICAYLPKVKAKYPSVGMADLIQFASAVAIKTCPLGPQMPFYAGRPDSSIPSTPGLLPPVTGTGDHLFGMFADKGFTATDLAALIGAHTTSRQFFVDPDKQGAAQDATPGTWDVLYYEQTLDGRAPLTFESDLNLANQAEVGPAFKGFVGKQAAWGGAFVVAMTKMSLLGVAGGQSSLIDCSAAVV